MVRSIVPGTAMGSIVLLRRHSDLKLTWQTSHEKRQWSIMKSELERHSPPSAHRTHSGWMSLHLSDWH